MPKRKKKAKKGFGLQNHGKKTGFPPDTMVEMVPLRGPLDNNVVRAMGINSESRRGVKHRRGRKK